MLMLDVAGVVRQNHERFDTVVFFDRFPERVLETQKRIPGATGIFGDFVSTVLAPDPVEDELVEGLDALVAPEELPDTSSTRHRLRTLAQKHHLIRSFPFDVVNLDLERYLFRPTETMPGDLVNALRRVFAWQRMPLVRGDPERRCISGFSLMFTTQIGPPGMPDDYITMLRTCLQRNLDADAELQSIYDHRSPGIPACQLHTLDYETFFRLTTPKLLAETLYEADWFVDPEKGITMFEFERPSKDGPYKMLHLVMEVKRQNPPAERRAPRDQCFEAQAASRDVVRRLFSEKEVVVTLETIDASALNASLERIRARRKLYYQDDMGTMLGMPSPE
ncbi:MAG: hypothetical protein ACYC5M_01030 [Anaerolineae bacterium]